MNLTEIEIKICNFRFLLITINSILVKLEFSFIGIPDSILVSRDSRLLHDFFPNTKYMVVISNINFSNSLTPAGSGNSIEFNSETGN